MNLFKRHFKPRYLWIALVTLVRQSKTFRITTVISFLFLLAMWFLPIWRIVPLAELKPFLPLHYNVYMGIDRFGPWYGAFVIPVLGTFLWIINSIFEALFFQKAHHLFGRQVRSQKLVGMVHVQAVFFRAGMRLEPLSPKGSFWFL